MLSLLILATFISQATPKVGIIGGGFAGISAAIELQKRGVPFTLLEATSRLGGRVYPIKTDDGQWLQMGAEYIYGDNNDLFRLAKGLDLINCLINSQEGYDSMTFGMARNKLNQTAVDLFVQFANSIGGKMREAAKSTPGMSAGDFYDKEYAKFVENRTITRETADVLSDTYKNSIETFWSAPAKQLALTNYVQWNNGTYRGKKYELKEQGYRTILLKLQSQILAKNVKINTKVTSIDWSGDTVLVTAVNSTPISFDSVIVTLPLGVLKKSSKLFTPSLSKEKLDAIKNIGYGSLQKVFLEYATSWWSPNATILVTPYTSQNNVLGSEMKIFEVVDWRNNTLLLVLAGEGPSETSGMSPKQLGSVVTSHLRTAFMDNSILEPAVFYTYNWDADPLFNGANSFISTKGYKPSEDYMKELATPVTKNGRPLLLFAGEHSHSSMYQTTVGAYESGMRQASRIIKSLNKTG